MSNLKEFLTGVKQEEIKMTPEQRLHFVLGVSSMQNALMGIMILSIFALGVTLAVQSNQYSKNMEKYENLLIENSELKLENSHLRELAKDKLKKIKRGAQYIEKQGIEKQLAYRYATLEMLSSIKHNIDYSTVLAITEQESSFRSDAVSWCCLGLKQPNYKVWKDYFSVSKDDLFKPEINIDIGNRILRKYMNETDSMEMALRRYYGSTVQGENVAYAQQVISRSQKIARALNS